MVAKTKTTPKAAAPKAAAKPATIEVGAFSPAAVRVPAPEQAVEAAVAVGQQAVEAAVAAGKETVDAVKAGTAAATKGYDEAVAATKANVEKASEAAFKGYDDIKGQGKDNLDAVVRANSVLAKGVETLGQEMIGFATASVAAQVAAAQALAGAKTFQVVIELQNTYARASFDQFVAESARLSELTLKVASETAEPLQARVKHTVETLFKPLAA